MATIDYSQVKKFESLELLAQQVVEGFITGLHKSPFHGFSVEFAEHRLYNPGESTRHIDWKLYGRTDKLFVKRYEEETNLRCQLVIDSSASMYYPEDVDNFNKISFSAYCCAALIQLLKRQRDAVGLSVFSEKLDIHTPAKSSVVHHKMLYNYLEKIIESETTSKTFVVEALHQIAESIHKRSMVMVFSDMLDNSPEKNDALFSALQHLKHNKHEVILFHVVDKKTEIDFEFENRPYTFIDKETGEEVKAHPSSVKESYVQQMKEYEKELRFKCSQFRIDFVEADINKGFDQVLLGYLIKRTKLH
ncbi:MAG: DUF58 domain-containing protein [Flavobacteriales bacterium]|nr:DUF58 domain-containing protein [Flavobacteriales bacterium]